MKKQNTIRHGMMITLAVLLGSGTLGMPPGGLAENVPDTQLEDFLGQPPGTLDGLGNGNATGGSAITQSFLGTEGQTVTLDWNFLTNETTPPIFNDFAFVSVLPSGGISTLANTNSKVSLRGNTTRFNNETGFNTFSYQLPADGTYTLGLGVVNVQDRNVESGLLVDNVNVGTNGGFETGDFSGWDILGSANIADATFGIGPAAGQSQALLNTQAFDVPEPSTMLGSGLLLVLGALLKRKAKSQNAQANYTSPR